jgi:hypothetical protein
VSALLAEELLEKIMLAKTKHKKLCFNTIWQGSLIS